MTFIVDTNVLIDIENNNEQIITQIKAFSQEPLYITFFTFCEFYLGIMNKSEKNKEKFLNRISEYPLLNTSKNTALIFCDLLNHLQKEGKTISYFDLFIASLTIEYTMTLLTLDKDFDMIPDLKKKVMAF